MVLSDDVHSSGFGVIAPNITDTQRPGLGAICTSSIWQGVLMDITSYDSLTLATVIPTTAPGNGTIVLASAFDGNAVIPPRTTSTTTSTACKTVSGLASPTPSGAICDIQADSVVVSGSGILVEYGSGSPYVASVAACGAQCLATTSCTNLYFNVGVNCNLHYGPISYVVNTNGVNSYSLYAVACFTCA